MYVSRAVRSLREHPVPDASVILLFEVSDAATLKEVRADLERIGDCTVLDEVGFDTLRVEVPQDRIETVCALDGLAAVETDATLILDADRAGEDIQF